MEILGNTTSGAIMIIVSDGKEQNSPHISSQHQRVCMSTNKTYQTSYLYLYLLV